MTTLIGACLAFLLTHLGVSSSPLRKLLVSVLGENGYLVTYSIVAFITLGMMIYAYSGVVHTDFLWLPGAIAYKVSKVIMLLAVILLVMGAMTRNPTQVKMERAINDEFKGVLKITRHPIQWSIILYSVAHLIANGDQASIVFFGTLGLVSLLGTFAIDAKKRARYEPEWPRFFATTSSIPFVALLTGRTRLRGGDINYLALGVGVALYAVIYWLHDMVSGGLSLF